MENIYRRCLVYELEALGSMVICEQAIAIRYEGLVLDGMYRLDMLVDDVIIVEVKAVEQVLPVHHAQLLSYLRLTNKRLGLLINFNVPLLTKGIKRVINGY